MYAFRKFQGNFRQVKYFGKNLVFNIRQFNQQIWEIEYRSVELYHAIYPFLINFPQK